MKFKKPDEYPAREDRTQVSARINVADKDLLTKEAKRVKKTLSELVGDLLEDYCKWLRSEADKRK